MRVAILIDGGFFLNGYRRLRGHQAPAVVANDLHKMCLRHVARSGKETASRLFRIFYYDCPPLSKKAHHPLTGRSIDFSKTDVAKWRQQFFLELKKLRKVAIRLGNLSENTASWVLSHNATKAILSKQKSRDELCENDVIYDAKQKGVDMKIGLDIASLAYKRFVDQIVLVAGDSDFVPAAKLARREGIDFVLDPMWANIRPDLFEHIDGLRSVLRKDVTALKNVDSESGTPTSNLDSSNEDAEFGLGLDLQ